MNSPHHHWLIPNHLISAKQSMQFQPPMYKRSNSITEIEMLRRKVRPVPFQRQSSMPCCGSPKPCEPHLFDQFFGAQVAFIEASTSKKEYFSRASQSKQSKLEEESRICPSPKCDEEKSSNTDGRANVIEKSSKAWNAESRAIICPAQSWWEDIAGPNLAMGANVVQAGVLR